MIANITLKKVEVNTLKLLPPFCVRFAHMHTFELGFIMCQYFFPFAKRIHLHEDFGFPPCSALIGFSFFILCWMKQSLFVLHSSQFLLEWVVVFCFLTIKSGEGILFVYFDKTQREIQDRCLLGCRRFSCYILHQKLFQGKKTKQNNLLRWFIWICALYPPGGYTVNCYFKE